MKIEIIGNAECLVVIGNSFQFVNEFDQIKIDIFIY